MHEVSLTTIIAAPVQRRPANHGRDHPSRNVPGPGGCLECAGTPLAEASPFAQPDPRSDAGLCTTLWRGPAALSLCPPRPASLVIRFALGARYVIQPFHSSFTQRQRGNLRCGLRRVASERSRMSQMTEFLRTTAKGRSAKTCRCLCCLRRATSENVIRDLSMARKFLYNFRAAHDSTAAID
jgi:hypothetical protein